MTGPVPDVQQVSGKAVCENLRAASKFGATWENVRAGHGTVSSEGVMDNSIARRGPPLVNRLL